mgnify:CR=1 FL=1
MLEKMLCDIEEVFEKEDQEKIDVAVKTVADACFDITKMDFNRVMGKYNKKG